MYSYKYIVDLTNFEEKDVYDGDTVRLTLDLGFGVTFFQNFRLSYIDAPELRGDERNEGLVSRDFLRRTLTEAKANKSEVIVITERDTTGKYGRYLADIVIDNVSINLLMVTMGLAEGYSDSL